MTNLCTLALARARSVRTRRGPASRKAPQHKACSGSHRQLPLIAIVGPADLCGGHQPASCGRIPNTWTASGTDWPTSFLKMYSYRQRLLRTINAQGCMRLLRVYSSPSHSTSTAKRCAWVAAHAALSRTQRVCCKNESIHGRAMCVMPCTPPRHPDGLRLRGCQTSAEVRRML